MNIDIPQIRADIRESKSHTKSREKDLQEAVSIKLADSGLSCREIAEMLGLSIAYIYDIQNCRRHISDSLLQKMRDKMGTKID